MIVNHKYRFIFLRTEKTGGASTEIGLGALCGPDDIISGIGQILPAQNASRRLGRLPFARAYRWRVAAPRLFGLAGHTEARIIKSMIDRQVWETYFKFAVERNPWDRQVSLYRHRETKRGGKIDFETYISSPLYRHFHHVKLRNWKVYTINDRIVADEVLRYERLADDLKRVCLKLGIDAELVLPRRHGEYRPPNEGYRHYYTQRSRKIVGDWYRNEIEAFGYEF